MLPLKVSFTFIISSFKNFVKGKSIKKSVLCIFYAIFMFDRLGSSPFLVHVYF